MKKQNPFNDLIFNILIPTLILSYASKESGKIWHIGPTKAMAAALIIPFSYGVFDFVKTKTINVFSCVGVFAILLTGGITIYLWNNENSRSHVEWVFGAKEAIQPLILGSLFLFTHRSKNSLFKTFFFNENLFNISAIENAIHKEDQQSTFNKIIWNSTLLFFLSFCLSAILNMGLSYYFLADLQPNADNWKILYNEKVAKITAWGFLIIGLPLMVFALLVLGYLIKKLQSITKLKKESLLMIS